MDTETVAIFVMIWAAVATSWAAYATWSVPTTAAKMSAELGRLNNHDNEKRRQKLFVFGSIMQDRPNLASKDTVRALNLIDALYHDTPKVRHAWEKLYQALCDNRLNSLEGGKTREDRQYELLMEMAIDLGYGDEFSPDDFSRVYYPESLARHDHIENIQRERAYQETIAAQEALPAD
jgi:hypothetical protein